MNHWCFPILEWEVYDGDTIRAGDIDLGFHLHLQGYLIRVAGVDTPEKYTTVGDLVTRVVEMWTSKADTLSVQSLGLDKYGKRFIGKVFRDSNFEDNLGGFLILNHLAQPYDGKGKTAWTEHGLEMAEDRARSLIEDNPT